MQLALKGVQMLSTVIENEPPGRRNDSRSDESC